MEVISTPTGAHRFTDYDSIESIMFDGGEILFASQSEDSLETTIEHEHVHEHDDQLRQLPHQLAATSQSNGHRRNRNGHNGHGHGHSDIESSDGVEEYYQGESDIIPTHDHGHIQLVPEPTLHIHAPHTDQHDHPAPHGHEDHPTFTRRGVQALVYGNLFIGAAGIAAGAQNTMSVTIDGAHNVADYKSYKIQGQNELNDSQDAETIHRRRKLAHSIIMLSSLVGIAKIGSDMFGGDEASSSDKYDIAVASASVLLNSSILFRYRDALLSKAGRTKSKDIIKHLFYVDIPSATLALGGALIQPLSAAAEHVIGIASGGVAAYAFRPTEKNLAHGSCLDPNHVHDHDHGHEHGHTDIHDGQYDHDTGHDHHEGHIDHHKQTDHGHDTHTRKKPKGILKKARSAVTNILLPPVVAAQVVSMETLEAAKKHKRVSAAVVGALGLYAFYRLGRDIAPVPKNHVALQGSTHGQWGDAMPTVPTGFSDFEKLQSAQETAQQVVSTVPLPKYNSTTHDGTLWRIAEQLLQSKSPKPTNGTIAELTQALLDDNGQTHASATQLPVGFSVVVNGPSTTNLLANSG